MNYSGHKKLPERTGFNMYAEYTRPQLTFLALVPCVKVSWTVHSRRQNGQYIR